MHLYGLALALLVTQIGCTTKPSLHYMDLNGPGPEYVTSSTNTLSEGAYLCKMHDYKYVVVTGAHKVYCLTSQGNPDNEPEALDVDKVLGITE